MLKCLCLIIGEGRFYILCFFFDVVAVAVVGSHINA